MRPAHTRTRRYLVEKPVSAAASETVTESLSVSWGAMEAMPDSTMAASERSRHDLSSHAQNAPDLAGSISPYAVR